MKFMISLERIGDLLLSFANSALAAAGPRARSGTLYVTLEPCDLQGRTPACTQAVLEAGIGRVVIGALDPNPNMAGRGVERLRESIPVAVAGDRWALALIEDFSVWIAGTRPYLTLKMAVSLDGFVAASPGTHWLTGERARAYVRELRSAADAVLVGAGTVRIDDPQLTVRPPRARRRPYQRVVACEADPIPPQSRVLARIDGYAPTIVLAPGGARGRFAELESVARVLYVGDGERLALALAFKALAREGISSVLCEGGPTLAGRLLAAGLVDRLAWLVTPQLFGNVHALRALGSADVTGAGTLQVDCVERLGDDLLVSARVGKDASCSAV